MPKAENSSVLVHYLRPSPPKCRRRPKHAAAARPYKVPPLKLLLTHCSFAGLPLDLLFADGAEEPGPAARVRPLISISASGGCWTGALGRAASPLRGHSGCQWTTQIGPGDQARVTVQVGKPTCPPHCAGAGRRSGRPPHPVWPEPPEYPTPAARKPGLVVLKS